MSGISLGTVLSTNANTWESVITMRGFTDREFRVFSNSLSRHTTGMAPLSKASLITCCCGSIRRPLGAALSIGVTSTIRSLADTRSDISFCSFPVFLSIPATRSLSSVIFVPFKALTHRALSFHSDQAEGKLSSSERSDLLSISSQGMFLFLNSSMSFLSAALTVAVISATSSAMSLASRARSARAMRSSPRALSSSNPGVSVIMTGPSGRSSMLFLTGSVVVPRISDTMESCCEVKAFTTLDLPAFTQPKNVICVLSPEGVSFMLIAYPL